MFVLDKLWRGTLSPNEPCVKHGSEYSEIRHKATFGAYLIHLMVMYFLSKYEIHSCMFFNLWGIPFFSVVVFVLSLLIAAILRRIPVAGRYIC